MEEYIKLLSVIGLLLSAVGIGNIAVKILDIIWLQRNIRKSEIDKWKRDQKIVAYSKLANDLISQKEWGNPIRSPEIYKLLGEVILLIENQNLITKIKSFYKNAEESLKISNGKHQQAQNCGDETLVQEAIDFHKSENNTLQNEAHEILNLLRKDMLS